MSESEERVAVWDPFRDWNPLREFREFGAFPSIFGQRGEGSRGSLLNRPPIDVTESDDEYAISVELPGVEKDDVTVECKDGVLTIHGEKKSEREEVREQARLLERQYGAFSRSLSMPQDAKIDGIKAKFSDGVLRVAIPKKPESKAKTVAIKG